ncbi:hypothetical protein AB595_16440 [Massilia sp. WF1]|nr:hypothetical protein AB595_16440 [Massilia sp. WF1]
MPAESACGASSPESGARSGQRQRRADQGRSGRNLAFAGAAVAQRGDWKERPGQVGAFVDEGGADMARGRKAQKFW